MAAPLTPAAPLLIEDLAGVEAALGRLWQASAAGADRAVLRAATFNLIAVVSGEAQAQAAAGILADVMAHQPGRVLIVSLDPEAAADRLQGWVTSHCRVIGDGTQVCGEQVLIAATGAAVERLAAAAPMLFVPDCPSAVWWRVGPGPATPFLYRLLPSVDAVLLDGTRFDPAGLVGWAGRLRESPAGITVGDLAWLRGRPWRGWLADCFEGGPARTALAGLSAVRVEHGPGAAMVGWLFAAWLAARVQARGLGVEVRAGAAAGGLTAVRLEAPRLRCELRREGAATIAVTIAHDGAVTRRVVRHEEPSEAALVSDWVAYPQWDPAYGEALGCLGALVR